MKNVIKGKINSILWGIKWVLYQNTKLGAANSLKAVIPKKTPTKAFLYAILTDCFAKKNDTRLMFRNKSQLAHAIRGNAAKSGTHRLRSAVPRAKQPI